MVRDLDGNRVELYEELPLEPASEPTRRYPARLRRRLQGGRGPLIGIAAVMVVFVIGAAAAILSLRGAGGSDVVGPSATTAVPAQPLQPGPISSFEDIAGTYFRHGPGEPRYFHFFEDGASFHTSVNRDLIVDRPERVYETRFEGTKLFLVMQAGSFCAQADVAGTYEIHVLESGNLQFVAVGEDACPARSGVLLGLGDGLPAVEYEPVP